MRIIAGRHRGREIESPKDARIRPTLGRLRETLFNILAHRPEFTFAATRIADLFAGTGALGLESLSRGASHVTFVDNHPASLALIRRNIERLGEEANSRLLTLDARKLKPADEPFDLVFMDPPYRKDLVVPTLQALQSEGWLKDESLIVVECGAEEELALPPGLGEVATRSQGDGKFIILRHAA
jgi:16S rRNA (guanine966-N2)-methyltransferase